MKAPVGFRQRGHWSGGAFDSLVPLTAGTPDNPAQLAVMLGPPAPSASWQGCATIAFMALIDGRHSLGKEDKEGVFGAHIEGVFAV